MARTVRAAFWLRDCAATLRRSRIGLLAGPGAYSLSKRPARRVAPQRCRLWRRLSPVLAILTLPCMLVAQEPPKAASAPDFGFGPNARLMARFSKAPAQHDLPVGRWSPDFGVPFVTMEGAVRQRSWRLQSLPGNALAALLPLRETLLAEGYEIVLDCAAKACGGFDFRFALDLLPAPAMFVDMTRYHVLSARRGEAALWAMASPDPSGLYIQLTEIAPALDAEAPDTAALPDLAGLIQGAAPPGLPVAAPDQTVALRPFDPVDLYSQLDRLGHAVLEDVRFASGSTTLQGESFPGLDRLAAYLREDTTRRVMIVGHSDALGSHAGNTRLSRRRAEAVVGYLRRTQGIRSAQLAAEGAGHLAPRASNLAEEGRNLNRRVEVILLP